jgi:hypothetical protein
MEASIEFKVDDDGNIFQVPDEELMNAPLHVSLSFQQQIMDTLKNLIVQSQDGGKRRRNHKSRKSTKKSHKRRTIRRARAYSRR